MEDIFGMSWMTKGSIPRKILGSESVVWYGHGKMGGRDKFTG
jgi:hypothetical protein